MPQMAGGMGVTGNVAFVTGGGAYDINWTAATNATGYKVYWDTIGGPPYANTYDVGNVLGVNYSSLSGIGTGTRYFNVRSYDQSALQGPWGTQFTKVVT
jgi:hypothetical protein